MQYLPFVIVIHHVAQNLIPSIVSNLPDPFHQTSSYRIFFILGDQSWNDYNYVILGPQGIKLWFLVALSILFPMPLV